MSGEDGMMTERRAKARCGAKTRAGRPCRRRGLGRGGRCPNHGGCSTGPKTNVGRRKVAELVNGGDAGARTAVANPDRSSPRAVRCSNPWLPQPKSGRVGPLTKFA
jgi:hypothetical protein